MVAALKLCLAQLVMGVVGKKSKMAGGKGRIVRRQATSLQVRHGAVRSCPERNMVGVRAP